MSANDSTTTPTLKETHRTMRLSDITPNFRVVTYGTGGSYVQIPDAYGMCMPLELPAEWEDMIRRTIDTLIREAGCKAPVFDEGGGYKGWHIPLDRWVYAISQPIPGYVWTIMETSC